MKRYIHGWSIASLAIWWLLPLVRIRWASVLACLSLRRCALLCFLLLKRSAMVFERGTWGCTAFLCAVSSSFSPRTRSAEESQHLSRLHTLFARSGLIYYILCKRINSHGEDPSREACCTSSVEASLTPIIFAEKRYVPWIRGCVIGFGSITFVPTATDWDLNSMIEETRDLWMDSSMPVLYRPSLPSDRISNLVPKILHNLFLFVRWQYHLRHLLKKNDLNLLLTFTFAFDVFLFSPWIYTWF